MKWRILCFALAVFLIASCRPAGEGAKLATAEEARAIVGTALAEMNYHPSLFASSAPEGETTPPQSRDVLVSSTTLCLNATASTKKTGCSDGSDDIFESPRLDGVAPRQLRAALLRINGIRKPIDLEGLPRVRIVDATEIDKLVDYRSWKPFYDRYPDTAGWVEVSQPVLSGDKSHALIYLEHRCGSGCATGTLLYLERTWKGWVVERKKQLWTA